MTDARLAEFKAFVMSAPLTFDEEAWQRDAAYIAAMVQKEIDSDLFGLGRAYQNLARRDPQLQFALRQFPEAQQLLELRGRRPAERAAAASDRGLQ